MHTIVSEADQWLSGDKQLEKSGRENYKEHKETFGGDCFTEVYIYQHLLNHTLQFSVWQSLNKAVKIRIAHS